MEKTSTMPFPNNDVRRAGALGTVYLLDDDSSMLEMLQDMVATIGVEVRAFSSSQAFLEAYRPMPCQCLVCDLRMPVIDGIGVQRRIAEMDLAPPIIFLTGYGEVESAVKALKHGAFDFMEKRTFSGQALLAKIQAALDASRGQYTAWLERQTLEARLALLTPKERDIVRFVVAGKSSREISELLGLSVRTVEHHRDHVMQKLHVQTSIELVKLFLGGASLSQG